MGWLGALLARSFASSKVEKGEIPGVGGGDFQGRSSSGAGIPQGDG